MKGLQTHRITHGDSLQKLARLYKVEDWRDIAIVNRLTPPYIDAVFGSTKYENDNGVAKIGDTIIIPSFKNNSQVPDRKAEKEIEILSYGEDLDLYKNDVVEHRVKGELSETGTDIKTAAGLSNLAQQLLSRLSVKQGALLMHPEFGSNLHKYVGKLDRQEDRNKALWDAERCLRTDFRVKEVADITIEKVTGGNALRARIIPIAPGEPFVIKYFIEE